MFQKILIMSILLIFVDSGETIPNPGLFPEGVILLPMEELETLTILLDAGSTMYIHIPMARLPAHLRAYLLLLNVCK